MLRTLAFVFVLLLTLGAQSEEPLEVDTLNFGIISTESAMNLRQGFEPFLEDMEAALGMPVKPFFATDYAGVIEAMRFGSVHVAWFGNKSAMEACNRANAEIFAQTVDAGGNPGYWSVIIVPKDSPYQNVDQIIADGETLSFGNGDPNSTSGYLIPYYYLWAERGIDPAKHFKVVRNSNHEGNIMAVANGLIDFATNNTETLGKIAETKPRIRERVRIIWKSPLIPSDPMVWRKDLPQAVKNKVKAFFLSYGRLGPNAQEERAVLAGMSSGWAPFQDSSSAQLLGIREIQLVKDRMEMQNATGISDEKRAAELARIDAELAELKAFIASYKKYF
jgi:phosphonate transport system substrate-binding protein